MKNLTDVTENKDIATKEYVDSAKNIWYGTCLSTAATNPKIVTTDTQDFTLEEGNVIYIQFDNASGNLGDDALQLNVDGTGAINIYSKVGTWGVNWPSGSVVGFVYNGTNFIGINKSIANFYWYGETKLDNAIDSTSNTTAATSSAVKQAYDLANGKQDALVSGTNIKTINNQSLLGSGNLNIQSEDEIFYAEYEVTSFAEIADAYEDGLLVICKVNAQDLESESTESTEETPDMYLMLPLITCINEEENHQIIFNRTFEASSINVYLSLENNVEQWNADHTLVQSDWSVTNADWPGYIKNKPTIPSQPSDIGAQAVLVSGTNIKTINNQSLLGSGNLAITGSGTSVPTADEVAEFDSTAHMNSTDMTSSEVTSFVNGLNMTGSKTADYVVEQGTDGVWTYRKWQSGIAECWGITPTASYAITSTYGSLYYVDATLCTFPTNLFISVPAVNIARTPNGGVGTGLVFAAINSVTTTNVKAYIANSTSGTWNFNFSISAKGRWK